MKSTAKLFFFGSLCTLLFAVQANTAFAQYKVEAPTLNYTPLTPIPFTGDCTPADIASKKTHCLPTSVPNLGRYLRGVYMLGVALAGLFAVFSIVRGGFSLLFTDSILGHSEGKTQILQALGGLLIVYSSYILMNQINPQLGRDLNLSLALPRITVTKGLFDQLLSLGDTNARTAIYSQLRGEITQGVKDSRIRADKEDVAAKAIMGDPRIQDLLKKRADGVDLSSDEKSFLDESVREAQKHQQLADNTRYYQLGIADIETEVVDAQHLVKSPWWTFVSDPVGADVTPEQRAQVLSQRVKGRITSLAGSSGDVVTDPAGIATKSTTEAIAELVTKANDAVSVLCNKQYGTTPSTPASIPGIKNPVTNVVGPDIVSQPVINRNRCIEANSINR